MPSKRKNDDVATSNKNKKVKTHVKSQGEDTSHSVLGGLKGGYRKTGNESTAVPGVSAFKVPFENKEIICERRSGLSNAGKSSLKPQLIFTHGAGGGIANPATAVFADGFSNVDPIVCFQGTMNLQSRVKTFHAVVEHESATKALGGRSMGARAAVITALESEENSIEGLVLVSYPLVGASKGDVRDGILKDLGDDIDVLFIAGSEDSMCKMAQLNDVRKEMAAPTWLVEVEGADHSMSLKAKKGVEAMRQATGEIAARWLKERKRDKSYCSIRWSKETGKIVSSGWTVEREEGKGKKPPSIEEAFKQKRKT